MNFLAHAYLSGDNHKLLLGNFIADFVKGRAALELFDEQVKKGIYLHRAIDAFTDSHAVVSESKKRLRPKYRHYAGVIVDVFYDHFLARNWHAWHAEPLDQFTSRTYETINRHKTILPESVKAFFPYMVKGNWLLNYAKVEGIGRALSGMAARTPYVSKMDEAVGDLVQYYSMFEREFEVFFPELKDHAKEVTASQQA